MLGIKVFIYAKAKCGKSLKGKNCENLYHKTSNRVSGVKQRLGGEGGAQFSLTCSLLRLLWEMQEFRSNYWGSQCLLLVDYFFIWNCRISLLVQRVG